MFCLKTTNICMNLNTDSFIVCIEVTLPRKRSRSGANPDRSQKMWPRKDQPAQVWSPSLHGIICCWTFILNFYSLTHLCTLRFSVRRSRPSRCRWRLGSWACCQPWRTNENFCQTVYDTTTSESTDLSSIFRNGGTESWWSFGLEVESWLSIKDYL